MMEKVLMLDKHDYTWCWWCSLHNNDRELYPHLREGIVLFLI